MQALRKLDARGMFMFYDAIVSGSGGAEIMGRNTKWTPEENTTLADGWARGERAADILDRLPGRTLIGMYNQAIKLGLQHKNRFKRGHLPPRIEAFMKAQPCGEFATAEIAKATGMSVQAALGILTRNAGATWHYVRTGSLNGKGYQTHIWAPGPGAKLIVRREHKTTVRAAYSFDPIMAALFGSVGEITGQRL